MMKTYEKPASQMFEMHTSGALLALSVVSGGSASDEYDVLSNRKGWNAGNWSDTAAGDLDE